MSRENTVRAPGERVLMAARTWTCQRQAAGMKCAHVNPRRNRLCLKCGKARPATKKPAHMTALDASYEEWVALYGEQCGICGRAPSSRRRLDRDHCHDTGKMRGLLCARCNRSLPRHITVEWLRAAIAYLERDVQPAGVRAVTPLDERRAA